MSNKGPKDKNKPQLSEDDAALFRSQMKGATLLKSDRVVHAKPTKSLQELRKRDPGPTQRNKVEDLPDFSNDSTVDGNDRLFFCNSELRHKEKKKLRRGEYPIDAKLDLHGLTLPVAKCELIDFFADSQMAGYRCVLLVHGRGFRSEAGIPILKRAVDQWLRQLPEVIAFSSALPKHGGVGAVYVLLRRCC